MGGICSAVAARDMAGHPNLGLLLQDGRRYRRFEEDVTPAWDHHRVVPSAASSVRRSRRPAAAVLLVVVLAASLIGTVRGGLDHLLPIINKLQDVTALIADQHQAKAIELPQIAVVGSQSSGKSSVLESIVGRDFLPRGSGIVTRAPLILQLQTTPASVKDGCVEWGEFLHCPKKKFTDFKEIRKEIEAETQRIVGGNRKQAITNTPIRLRITSPRVPNLTMVDLPGMTKVPVGDQPKDIEVQIRDLLLQYIANPNCIVLAVTPANSDIATSDAIQLARAVDPKGDRTVGVLTKIDLMDKGTDAADALMGRLVPLKLGFIGVINRSQKDIQDDKAIADARADEIKFFRDHAQYAGLVAAGKVGTAYLAKRLNNILVMHIKYRLPALRNRLSGLLNSQRKELAGLGEAPSGEADDLRKMLISLITQYVDSFCTTIDGGGALTSPGGGNREYTHTRAHVSAGVEAHLSHVRERPKTRQSHLSAGV